MGFDPIAYINEPQWHESRLGLERTAELLDRMGRPQDRLKFVHVAGTNGKGSTCAYVGAILRACGLRVGSFSSPAVLSFNECIAVNGVEITSDELLAATAIVRDHAERMQAEVGEHPTQYELTWAVALEHFARSMCDIVIAEVGLGGLKDATNIIDNPEVSIITRIGLDHQDMLGSTIERIAGQKAGIVKPGSRVVAWPEDGSEAYEVVCRRARELASPLIAPDFSLLSIGAVDRAERSLSYRGRSYSTRMLGRYQPYNAVLAVESALALADAGWPVTQETIAEGIEEAFLPGRFQVVPDALGQRAVVLDGGHNPQGAEALVESLKDVFPGAPVVFVMSVLADKDYRAMIRTVAPLSKGFVCVEPPNPRALSAERLATAVREEAGDGLPVMAVADFSRALEEASALMERIDSTEPVESVNRESVICVFGSLYSLADATLALKKLEEVPNDRKI